MTPGTYKSPKIYKLIALLSYLKKVIEVKLATKIIIVIKEVVLLLANQV